MRLFCFEIKIRYVGIPKTSNQKIRKFIKEGNTLYAIKEYRSKNKNCTLREARDYIFSRYKD